MIVHQYADASIRFLQLHLGGDRNFSYLLGDRSSRAAAAVDPGFRADQFVAIAKEYDLKIEMILITHGHSDHRDETNELIRLTAAELYAAEEENIPGAQPVNDGDRLALGAKTIVAYHTPGHSPGHVCYLFERRLITGDLLFCGKVGGTGPYFPGSSSKAEWDSLQRITKLPDSIQVFPGHDYYGGEGKMQQSTIGYEKRHNPFLLCANFEAFMHLKNNWNSYKAEHGIR